MDALLILGGLLLILVGLVWLVMRAFATSLLWGWGSLLPPLTLFYVLRHWRFARAPLTLAGLGFIPLIVGMTLLASQDSQRLEAILATGDAAGQNMVGRATFAAVRRSLPPLIFGVAFGNLLQGVPFHFDDLLRIHYTGSFFALLNPFALLVGVLSLLMFVSQGAAYLQMKTEGDILKRSQTVGLIAGLGAAAGRWAGAAAGRAAGADWRGA